MREPDMPTDSPDSANGFRQTDGPRERLGAGAAYVRAIENDSDARAALHRAQARMRAFAEALRDPESQRDRECARRELEQALEALGEAFQESLRASQQSLAALAFSPPETLEDWEHLARVVEMPFETIQSGNFTAGDVYVMALAWVERQRVRARLVQAGNDPPADSFTVAALREMTTMGNTALNEYAKKAGVTTPRRGEKNFRYGIADVRKILETILTHTTEKRILTRCRAALASLPEITK